MSSIMLIRRSLEEQRRYAKTVEGDCAFKKPENVGHEEQPCNARGDKDGVGSDGWLFNLIGEEGNSMVPGVVLPVTKDMR